MLPSFRTGPLTRHSEQTHRGWLHLARPDPQRPGPGQLRAAPRDHRAALGRVRGRRAELPAVLQPRRRRHGGRAAERRPRHGAVQGDRPGHPVQPVHRGRGLHHPRAGRVHGLAQQRGAVQQRGHGHQLGHHGLGLGHLFCGQHGCGDVDDYFEAYLGCEHHLVDGGHYILGCRHERSDRGADPVWAVWGEFVDWRDEVRVWDLFDPERLLCSVSLGVGV